MLPAFDPFFGHDDDYEKKQNISMPLPLTCLLNAGFPPFVIAWAKNGEVSVNSDISAEIVVFFGVDRDLPKLA